MLSECGDSCAGVNGISTWCGWMETYETASRSYSHLTLWRKIPTHVRYIYVHVCIRIIIYVSIKGI